MAKPIIDYALGETGQLSTQEFVDEKLKLYSAHSNVRGIPFLGDGFKQAQRKAIYGMVLRGEAADKDTVERLSAKICSDTDYHHGAGSMCGTLVCLAQKFAGSNNLNLIEPFGQFGNRLSKKAASDRYIKAKLSPNFRKLFRKEDDLILKHHYSNGTKIEPLYFIPLLPLSLVNGAEGMGTGHSTYIMSYNPQDLKIAITTLLAGKNLTNGSLVPWFGPDFKGTVIRDAITGQIVITGKYEIDGSTTIKVSELPIGLQNDAYEAHLHKLADKEIIKNFTNSSDEEGFDFEINVPRTTTSLPDETLLKHLKLISRESENLTLWDTDGVLRRFGSVEEIIEHFVEWRLARYEDRRQALIALTEEEIVWLDERIRFIEFYLANSSRFTNSKKDVIIAFLEEAEFSAPDKLLSMQIWSLTADKIAELKAQLEEKLVYLELLGKKTSKEMYLEELKQLKF